ncbi:MAG TPA: aminoglycoside phosphotransferase family protein [Candidatus Cryosericum sp.]|nr:aminoglycoside phosphotransferase family protein [Candidatus Cryosericum sp.]
MSKPRILRHNLIDHPSVRAWQCLAPGSPVPRAIEVLRISAKSAVYRLHGATEGSTLVAKRCPNATGRIERIVYEEILHRSPVPALRLFGSLFDPDGEHCWLFLENAGLEEYRPASVEHRMIAGRWLGTLEAFAAEAGPFLLPGREPAHYLSLLRAARDAIRPYGGNRDLPENPLQTIHDVLNDLDVLESHWDEIESGCASFPRTIVHGDLAIKNVRLRGTNGSTTLLAFDWENAGWGVPGSDLAQFTGRTISPALDEYRLANGAFLRGFDDEAVARIADYGRYFRLLDDITWACCLPADSPFIFLDNPIATLAVYHNRLAEAFRESGWSR